MKKGSGKIIAGMIVLLLLIILAANYSLILDKGFGIQEDSEYMDNEGLIQLLDEQAQSSIHLRDKELLYSDDNQVVTMYLTVSKGNASDSTNHTWEEVNTYSAYDYAQWGVDRYKVEGLLQVGTEDGIMPGSLGYGYTTPNATVQVRGQTSSRNSQKNYKIELNRNVGTWNGQRTIALNKHQSDGLRFRNKMCFDLLNGIDELMGLRTTFVHLYIKDLTGSYTPYDAAATENSDEASEEESAEEQADTGDAKFVDYGLYTQVEQLNKTALRAHGLDKNGQLYKVNFFEFYRYEDVIKLASDKDYNKTEFEKYLEIKGDEDHTKLISTLEDVNDMSMPIEEVIEKHFDEENLCYWLALNILLGNNDTQSRNCYLYSPKNSERFYFYCWDFDAALMYNENQIEGRVEFGGWERGVSNYWGNMLFQRCLKSDQFRKKLDYAIRRLRDYLTEERLTAAIADYRQVVEPYVFSEPDVTFEHLTKEEYDKVAKELPDLIDLYYQNYVDSLEYPLPFYIGTPTKKGTKMGYSWDVSYDFQQDDIMYIAKVARDRDITDVVYEYEGYWPSFEAEIPEPGQYFIKVVAVDEDGNETPAFDYYVTQESSKLYGTMCFYVSGSGAVTVYEQEE